MFLSLLREPPQHEARLRQAGCPYDNASMKCYFNTLKNDEILILRCRRALFWTMRTRWFLPRRAGKGSAL